LRLQKLTAYGIGEIETEINKLSTLIIGYNKILGSKKELYKLISEELLEIKTRFAVPRRTKITDAELNYSIEETIQKESVVINITNQGYIKRSPLTSLKQQKRGGVGKSSIVTRDEDFVVQIFTASTHTPVLFFSSEGLAFRIKAWKIPEGSTSSKGKSLFNILPLKSHQSISSIMPLPESESEWKKLFIVFVTANGNVRKNSLDDFSNINVNGKIAMKLEINDKIVGVKICRDDQDIMLSTKKGKCIRFMAKKLRLFKGRSSKGIRGIQLSDSDKVISLSVLDSPKIDSKIIKKDEKIKNGLNKFILSITENGYGKRTSFLEYRVTNRGGKGIIGIINSPRNGNVASTLVVEENDEIILSTDKGSVMRCAVKEIRSAGRNTQGVTIKKLSGSEKVVSAIKIEDNIN
jgi:DNA gyrase subunit A